MLRNVTILGRVLHQARYRSIPVTTIRHGAFRPLSSATVPHVNVLASLEEKASAGNIEDMLLVGRQLFDQNVPDRAEYWLGKAAELGSLEAQYLAGVLLVSTAQSKSGSTVSVQDSTTVTVEASNASEVRSQIMKLRKESMFEKRSSQKSNLDDFNEALRKRKEKLEQQNNPSNPLVPEPKSTVTMAKPVDSRTRGLKWLQTAAKRGHGPAMCYLGNELLAEGQRIVLGDLPKNTPQDINHAAKLIHQAMDWYSLSAKEGKMGAAAYNLGVLFHDGVEHTAKVARKEEKEETSALPDLVVTKVSFKKGEATESSQVVTATPSPPTSTSDTDSAPATTTTIVPANLDESLSYFLRAAELGEPAAKLWCGYCYCTEEGGVTGVQPAKAVRYLQSACEHEETAAKAHFYLAQIYHSGLSACSSGGEKGEERKEEDLEADHRLFLLHLQLAIQGGNEDALYLLADMHLQRHIATDGKEEEGERQGGSTEEEDREVAFLHADLLAAPVPTFNKEHAPHVHVHSESCGTSCGHDHDHKHDHSDDHKHSEAASSHPEPPSSSSPALPLSKQHLLRAVVLLVQASAAGQAEATLTLGALTYQGQLPPQRDTDGAPISNKRRAFELYQLAAEQGSTDAWRNVASMHYLGDGVPKSEELAKEIMKVVFGKK